MTDNPVKKFVFTKAQEKARRVLSGSSTNVMLFGGSRCVSGDTVIDGQSKTIKDLAEAGEPVDVITSRGVVRAEAPFKKGACRMLRIELDSGRTVTVTPDHRFWDGRKWVRANQISVGTSLAVLSSETSLLAFPAPTSWIQSFSRHLDTCLYRFCLFFGFSYDTPAKSGYVLDKVCTITETAKQSYYTLHVPVDEQYFANGILHHNSGKTFLIVRTVILRALKAAGSRHAIMRFRFNAVKASIIMDTFPKVMKLAFPGVGYRLDKSDWYTEFENGSQIWFGGLDDKERTEKILGMEFATMYLNESSQIPWSSVCISITRLAQKAEQHIAGKEPAPLRPRMYFDCNPPSKAHWSYLLFIKKVSPDEKRPLLNQEDYDSFRINPIDNKENITKEYMRILEGMSPRNKKRFLYGEFADATPNGLFPDEYIDRWRVLDGKLPDMVRIVVGVDPSGAGDVDNADNDEIGIVIGGLGTDGNAYLLEDSTVKAGPAVWGKVATDAYERHEADVIVGEKNFGGAMVEHVIRTSNPRVNFRNVTASRGKTVRAEPFSPLYEQGKVRHVGRHHELEDEMSAYSTHGYLGEGSPNRVDAWMWVLASLFPSIINPRTKKRPVLPKKKATVPGMGI